LFNQALIGVPNLFSTIFANIKVESFNSIPNPILHRLYEVVPITLILFFITMRLKCAKVKVNDGNG